VSNEDLGDGSRTRLGKPLVKGWIARRIRMAYDKDVAVTIFLVSLGSRLKNRLAFGVRVAEPTGNCSISEMVSA